MLEVAEIAPPSSEIAEMIAAPRSPDLKLNLSSLAGLAGLSGDRDLEIAGLSGLSGFVSASHGAANDLPRLAVSDDQSRAAQLLQLPPPELLAHNLEIFL